MGKRKYPRDSPNQGNIIRRWKRLLQRAPSKTEDIPYGKTAPQEKSPRDSRNAKRRSSLKNAALGWSHDVINQTHRKKPVCQNQKRKGIL